MKEAKEEGIELEGANVGELNSDEIVTDKFPPSIKYIMGNEACERFSFYGLRAILELYFINNLMFTENQATLTMHIFVFFAYMSTIPGGIISDMYLGKYKTILYISFIYIAGSAALSLAAIPPSVPGTIVGLFLVALGTGGIKACVSAFVGDQFVAGQEKLLEKVFGLFYFCINFGSLLSTIITPLLREYVSPAVAFALPAFLLFIATVIFWSGRKQYRIIPPGGSILKEVFIVTKDALVIWFSNLQQKVTPRVPFWDCALVKHPASLVEDIRVTIGVLKIFLFLPMFWSLFDQHGSRWVLQAQKMDRDFYFFSVTGDQMPTLNPLFTLSLIPIFQMLVYPICEDRLGISLKPLRKMIIGMFFTGISFTISAFLQIAIDNSPPNTVHVATQIPQYFILSCGEIMVSVTGLELAYSQAPVSMKSLVMAGWQITVAAGNLLVAFIAAFNWPRELVYNFFLYALLMFLFDIIFYFFTRGYVYRTTNIFSSTAQEDQEEYMLSDDNDNAIEMDSIEPEENLNNKQEKDD